MRAVAKRWIRPDKGYTVREELILRDHLALVRTRLANERTLLSYIRSSLYLLVGGLALIGVADSVEIRWTGYSAVTLSVLFVAFGVYRYSHLRRDINAYYPKEEKGEL